MPDRVIVAYYTAVADKILPFFRGRRVAVRHTFDHGTVFRRHPTSPKLRGTGRSNRRWITIEDRDTLLEIVRQHGYEFFPHLEGEHDLWFALDIDIRSIPLKLGVVAVQITLDILEERGVKYLLTFSGGNGFHIRWAFVSADAPRNTWASLRAIVRNLQEETERRLQTSPHRAAFYQHIPKGDPITEANAMDTAAQHSILFDELILKPQATIRAPFSVHMTHRWTAIPVDSTRLETFSPARDAAMAKAKAHPSVRLPENPVSLFRTSPWNL